MARLTNVPVFRIDVGAQVQRAFGSLRQEQGFSGRAQTRMALAMRDAIRAALIRTVQESDFPVRTGRSKKAAIAGARAFGTSFATLRGHIVGPSYIAVQEDGAEITPKNGDWLAIPFGDAVRPDGTPKLPGPRSWQNIKKTFVYKSKKTGGLYIAYRKEDKTLSVIYVLVESVKVRGKHFLRNSWAKQAPLLGRDFAQIMHNEMSKVDILSIATVTYKGRQIKKAD